jgi:superoxide reductase
MKNVKIYKCDLCKNIVLKLEDHSEELVCCNQKMKLLVANTSDGAGEKHIPFITGKVKDCKTNTVPIYEVQIGSVEHPMTNEHHIT